MTPAHLGLALIVNMAWGYAFVAAKLGVQNYPPIFFTALRWAVVGVLLAYFLRTPRGQVKLLIGISLTMGALHYALMYTGFSLSGDVASVAIAVQLSVPFTTIMGVMFLGERIGWRRVAAISIALAGVVVIGFDPVVFEHMTALILVALSAAMFAAGSILINRAKGLSTWSIQAWMAVLSAPQLLVLSLIFEEGQWEALVNPNPVGLWALFYAVVGTSFVGLGGWYYLLQRYPVSTIAPVGLLTPVLGVVAGVVFMGDALSPELIIGGALTLAGVGFIIVRVSRLSKRGPDKTPEAPAEGGPERPGGGAG